MNGRHRVENRAHLIYDYLTLHIGEGFTITELCDALDIYPGATTTAAINRARDLATEAGLHFPPAVPANKQRYVITRMPADALDPTLHMGRIVSGVRRREQVGIDFMEREKKLLPPDLKAIADFYLGVQKTRQRAAAEMERQADDMVMKLVKLRRGQRGS